MNLSPHHLRPDGSPVTPVLFGCGHLAVKASDLHRMRRPDAEGTAPYRCAVCYRAGERRRRQHRRERLDPERLHARAVQLARDIAEATRRTTHPTSPTLSPDQES